MKENQYRDDLDEYLQRLRTLSPVPVITGFGVSIQEDILCFNCVSDTVIMGSKITKDLHEGTIE
ncbi:tryptophan synthase subunit alpha [Streptococcus pluranimalium]